MSYSSVITPNDYTALKTIIADVCRQSPSTLSALCNISAVLFSGLSDLNWCGFYLLQNPDALVLGPFQGKVACDTIKLGRGVCGSAAKLRQTLVVPNVHEFPGHIQCDSCSNSEIVVALLVQNSPQSTGKQLVGVLDIDSPVFDRFKTEDKEQLEAIAEIICQSLNFSSLL